MGLLNKNKGWWQGWQTQRKTPGQGISTNFEVHFFEAFSHVVKAPTVLVVLSLAMTYGWQIQQIDIYNAFLNNIIKVTLYMKQSDGFEYPTRLTHVYKLK